MRRSLAFLLAFAALPGTLRAQNPPASASRPARGIVVDLGAAPTAGRGQFRGGRGAPTISVASLPVTRVSLDIDRASPADIAKSIKSTPAFEFSPHWGGDPRDEQVTLHLKDAPLMQAVMEYREQSHTDIIEATPKKITFGYTPDKQTPPWCVAGPFAVLLHGLSTTAGGDWDSPAPAVRDAGSAFDSRFATVRMQLIAEPGTLVSHYLDQMDCPGLEDDKHQPLSISSYPGIEYRVHPSLAMIATARITLPESHGRRIPVFRGSFSATMVSQTQRLNLGNLAAGQTLTLAGMTLDIPPLPDRPIKSLEIRISKGTMPDLQWRALKSALAATSLAVTDSQHRPIFTVPGGTVDRSAAGGGFGPNPSLDDQAVTVNHTLVLSQDQTVDSATLDVPVAVQQVQIPFEFRDVILP